MVDSLKNIFSNDTLSLYDTYYNSMMLIVRNGTEEDREYLFEMLIDYMDKNVEEEMLRHSYLSIIYREFSFVYNRTGDIEKQLDVLRKSVYHVEQTDREENRARIYESYGIQLIRNNQFEEGYEYYYKAIRIYEKLTGLEDHISTCLYVIASSYVQLQDTMGVRKVLGQMKENLKNTNEEMKNTVSYNLYTIQTSYFILLLEQDSLSVQYVDSAILSSKRAIDILENHSENLSVSIAPHFIYYKLATIYYDYYPGESENVFYYLDKAENTIPGHATERERAEIKSKIYLMRGRMLSHEKAWDKAEQSALAALDIISILNDDAYSVDYSDIYRLLSAIYEGKGEHDKALFYHKQFSNSEEKRYSEDKIKVVNELSTQYEVEKKETRIKWLEEKNKTARIILLLTIGLLVILLITIFFIIRFYRLRKKNLEQDMYESVLLAELAHNELQQNMEEKKLLEQEYNNLTLMANEKTEKIEQYNIDLKEIKRKLEQKPTKAMVEKIAGWIKKSLIEKDKKDQYIKQLSRLDTDMLERGYLTAEEKLTNMDMKYIICFSIDMDVKDISLLFNVEPASVRTVRYRIKKKFGKKDTFKFLI